MGVAEVLYPLTTSSLWQPKTYPNLSTELKHLRAALGTYPNATHYHLRMAQVCAEVLGFRASNYPEKPLARDLKSLVSDQQTQALVTKALESYQQAIRLSPTNANYHLELGWFYDFLQARHITSDANGLASLEMDRALALSPRNLRVRHQVAEYCFKRGQMEKAFAIIRTTIHMAPQITEQNLLLLGRQIGNYSFVSKVAPAEDLETLLKFRQALYKLDSNESRAEALRALLPVLEAAAVRNPDAFELLFSIGHTQESLQIPGCIEWYARAYHATLIPEQKLQTLEQMMDFHLRRKEFAQACALTEMALREHSCSLPGKLFYLYGLALWGEGNLHEATDAIKKALADPSSGSGAEHLQWQDQLAGLYVENQDYPKAIDIWEKVLCDPSLDQMKEERKKILNELDETRRKMGPQNS